MLSKISQTFFGSFKQKTPTTQTFKKITIIRYILVKTNIVKIIPEKKLINETPLLMKFSMFPWLAPLHLIFILVAL